MIELGTGVGRSDLPARVFVERWADPETWAAWDPDVRWARLTAPVRLGARGTLQPASGPRLRFTVTAYEPDREFTDTADLPGARLTFQHIAERTATDTELFVRITIDGPMSKLFAKLLGAQLRSAAQNGLDRLVSMLERQHA